MQTDFLFVSGCDTWTYLSVITPHRKPSLPALVVLSVRLYVWINALSDESNIIS